MTTQRWKLTLEYDGTAFYGFQKQKDVPTIQGELESAIHKFCQQPIPVTVAGRTDAGVHARAQIAHMDLDYGDRPLTGVELAKAITAHLRPHPIAVIQAQKVSNDFHARFSAKQKTYRYTIFNRQNEPTIDRHTVWWMKRPLDVTPMIEATRYLIGHHDFSTFRDKECQANTPLRTLDNLIITKQEIIAGQIITIDAIGQSFLHHMVRNIVGTLTLVGEGKWRSLDIKTALEAKDRKQGGPTAPASGLTLMHINYEE